MQQDQEPDRVEQQKEQASFPAHSDETALLGQASSGDLCPSTPSIPLALKGQGLQQPQQPLQQPLQQQQQTGGDLPSLALTARSDPTAPLPAFQSQLDSISDRMREAMDSRLQQMYSAAYDG